MKYAPAIFTLLLFLTITMTLSQDTLPAYGNYINFFWKGGLTSHSVVFKVFPNADALTRDSYNAFLVLYTETGDDTNPIANVQVQPLTFQGDTSPVATVNVQSLTQDTVYSYVFFITSASEVTADSFMSLYPTVTFTVFHLRTLGIALLPYNFTFGASCCAQTLSTDTVFGEVNNQSINFFIHTGGLHSESISDNNVTKYYNAYYSVFNNGAENGFLQNTSLYYIWNDDDFGLNNSGKDSVTKPAATQAYRNFVPTGTLKGKVPTDDFEAFPDLAPQVVDAKDQYLTWTNGTYGIFQSFIVGRCLFIILDLKSYKDIDAGEILGNDQLDWLENQFIFASVNPTIKQVFIVSSLPWVDTSNSIEWSKYPETLNDIKGWVKQYIQKGQKIMMICGDAHMIALDDGTNNAYGGFPVVQAGALDQNPNCEGGPYSHGLYQGREQYALFHVNDNNDGSLCVSLELMKHSNPLIVYDTCHPEKYHGVQQSCPMQVQEEANGGSSSWLIFLVGFALLGIVGYLVWSCYRTYKAEKEEEKPAENKGNYMELSETKKKRENEQL